ncbi:triphosphoribosyl-dephospho-CoA synthase CitG [Lactobacillus sp. ESL0785]|uniref:triphosphoribosyl-dephospho-CoA synthase CitG n=1 Tax=Lactobacillus sp. ESL0785 TaxID=2983232 RepID=UPI0023FA382B|nr:triphosphoribosyl-dephospho-CoA synthase CitG [Lactobacillus sp. ESL0785]WEV70938.1 triphosphoribosyl-dephospho-CoA synthase CitG [Lactobacillus sp. ESL0785]
MTNSITQNALRALLYEVATEPKPGLVDPHHSGPHPDMNIYTFIDSSLSLTQYLTDAVIIGRNFKQTDLRQMFFLLRQKGISAEKAMFTATEGINTHKGAIFALGIFTCAESYSQIQNTNLFTTIRHMCCGLVKHDLGNLHQPQTAGEQEFIKYGYGGARAEAEQGYPLVEKVALPFLKNSTGSLQVRLLDTLMKIATVANDSNLIKRAGNPQVINWLHQQAKTYLALGGYATPQGRKKLQELNQACLEHNYSLGGCADLLIVTIFVGLEQEIL